MFTSIRKWWDYLGAKLGLQLAETADPKVQLEQAISAARDQHRRLTDQAANVIANQKQLEGRLYRAIDGLQGANASAGQALTLADAARRSGNDDEAARLEVAAGAFAERSLALEGDIGELKATTMAAIAASDRAREAVNQDSATLQRALADRERLLSQLDQAVMQEQLNGAMRQLTATTGDGSPSLDEVRTRIERRLARAQATSELTGVTVDASMQAVERAGQQARAQVRLGEMRERLGLPEPSAPASAASTIWVSRVPQPAIEAGSRTAPESGA